jgi:hypothetical protein
VQLLPKGVPHAIRIPEGEARLIQVSIGSPYDGFARDMAALLARGAPLEDIAEAAARHGVFARLTARERHGATRQISDV